MHFLSRKCICWIRQEVTSGIEKGSLLQEKNLLQRIQIFSVLTPTEEVCIVVLLFFLRPR